MRQVSEEPAARRRCDMSSSDSDCQWKDSCRQIGSKSGNGSADLGVLRSAGDLGSLPQTDDASTSAEFQSSMEAASSQLRAELIRAVFSVLDLDGDGRLQEHEVRRLVEHAGCFCSDKDWVQLYSRWCMQNGREGNVPADLALLEALVSNESEEDGYYCSNDELRSFLSSAATPDTGTRGSVPVSCDWETAHEVIFKKVDLDLPLMSRSELVREVFALLDRDRDERLNQVEMKRFAQMTGFCGTDEDWADAYGLLCRESGGDPLAGVDAALLAKLVDDESEESGCYCSTKELRGMLRELRHPGVRHQDAGPAHP